MTGKDRERLEAEIQRLQSLSYRQSVAIIKLHGGEVRSHRAGPRGRGRPKGSGDVTAAQIMTKHRELYDTDGKHVTQERLAEAVGLTRAGLKHLIKVYGLGWPLD